LEHKGFIRITRLPTRGYRGRQQNRTPLSVAAQFGGDLRIGIGINTGVVIAGTIGGGGKLEFTLIGDAVNVAARVEQLTNTTGDTILLT
jgi:class 3 adenylate cyclase